MTPICLSDKPVYYYYIRLKDLRRAYSNKINGRFIYISSYGAREFIELYHLAII